MQVLLLRLRAFLPQPFFVFPAGFCYTFTLEKEGVIDVI